MVCQGQGRSNLNSEIRQVVLVLEKSRCLTVTLMERNSAGRFGPCFDAESQDTDELPGDKRMRCAVRRGLSANEADGRIGINVPQ